ncbi:MAG: type IV pilus modification PilV family protein [Gemmatimonadales bacterium]
MTNTRAHTLRDRGFTLIEVLVSMGILAVATLALGTLLVRSSRTAEAASAGSYRTAALSAEVGRLGAIPFTQLAAGTTCATVTANPFPHGICSTIANVSAKIRRVSVVVTPANAAVAPDSVVFERAISGEASPPLSTP